MKLPIEFTERMRRILGEEYGVFEKSYEETRKFGLRVNTMKISPEEFERIAPFHLKKIPWIPNGYSYAEEDTPARHPFYYAGLYYLQEPSAMTPASVLEVSPGEKVLDLCAAPGGKATELGAKLGGSGLLVANDISASRVKALLKNIEVFGISNAFVTNAVPARLSEQLPEFFDRILVDAPCSGEGMFRKDEDSIRAWYPKKPAECAKIQRDLVLQATDMLRPGGTMLYSTCTFSPEENEEVILHLLRERPDMKLQRIPHREGFSEGLLDEVRECVRLWPHKTGGEGHFLALLRKDGPEEDIFSAQRNRNGADQKEWRQEEDRKQWRPEPGRMGKKLEPERKGRRSEMAGKRWRPETDRMERKPGRERRGFDQEKVRSILQDFFGNDSFRNADWDLHFEHTGAYIDRRQASGERSEQSGGLLEVRGDQAYLVPKLLPAVSGIPFLRNGLYLGELKKDRFEPSQSLAMALRKEDYKAVIDLPWEDDRVLRYLRGETIEISAGEAVRENGWQLLCVSGYPLGWGKLVNGLLKNKYHAGWRMK